MKLILTQEVTGLGTAGDVVDVKDGYARNLLIPRHMAMPWSAGGEKQIEGIRRARKAREVRDLDHAKEIKSALEAKSVPLKAKAGDKGKLFGSVTEKDVAYAVKQAGGPDLDRRRIVITKSIKNLGAHRVTVTLHPQVKAVITLDVVSA
jgi:large subunit ribosomal protein L9